MLVRCLLLSLTLVGCGNSRQRDSDDIPYVDLRATATLSEGERGFVESDTTPDRSDDWRYDVGGGFLFTLSEGFHMTQYSTNITWNGLANVFRVAQGQDPNYLGIYPGSEGRTDGCSRYANRVVRMVMPSANFRYCHSALNPERFNEMFGFQYAVKHMEIGSSPSTPDNQVRRVLVQLFEPRTDPFTADRSWFHRICDSSRDPVRSVFVDQPIFDGYWEDERGRSTVGVCTLTGSGAGSSIADWKVAGYEWRPKDEQGFTNGEVLEVVYMEKLTAENAIDYKFARNFQRFMLKSLEKTNPF